MVCMVIFITSNAEPTRGIYWGIQTNSQPGGYIGEYRPIQGPGMEWVFVPGWGGGGGGGGGNSRDCFRINEHGNIFC